MRLSTTFGAHAALAALLLSAPTALADQPAAEPPVEEEAPDPARPAPAGKGAVWGVVKDSASKEPVLDATVTVVGTKQKATADIDGRYRLELAPGTYELRVWYEGHKARRLTNVTVTAGKVSRIDVALDPDKVVEDVVEVEVTPERASAAAQLVMRRNAASTGDAVGAQDIARTPDRNAAEAAKRVVGATVESGKYVYVRGLGNRYTNSLLNGTSLPSPEPDRQAVPLDLFPSLVISDITIAKTFTPDMPGDFAGGSVRVNTRELPEKFLFSATLSAGFNTQSTFANRLSYAGSSMDWIGLDGGARALPKDIPPYKLVRLGPKNDGTLISKDELTEYGRALNSYMTTRPSFDWPNLSGNVVAGNTFKFGKSQELGVVGALTYGRRFSRRTDEIVRTYTVDPTKKDTLDLRNDYKGETGLDQVSWGAYSTITYKPTKDHRLTVTGLHSRSSDNEARIFDGFNDERGADLRDTRLRFVTRSLTFGQIAGAHKIAAAGDAVVDWNLSLSYVTSDEPDTRETVYVLDGPTGIYNWDRGTLSGSHFYGKQRETGYGGGLDWTQPLVKGDLFTKLKVGALFNKKARSFDARRFHFIPRSNIPPETFAKQPDDLFRRENIGTLIELEEYTRPNDVYTASHDVYSGYMMADTWVHPRVRLIFGARVEASRQRIDSYDPYSAELAHVKGDLDTTDLLPSIGAVLKVTKDANLRISAARTVARPELRELSPFVFTDYFGAREIFGNPDLKRTSIYNADLRFEIFPGSGEVAALSVFYKQFYSPIETVILPSNAGIITYQNAKGARVAGVELEVRKGLGFLAPVIKDLGVLGNLTLVSSRVELDDAQAGDQTNQERPLAGQSPFVINAGLDYNGEATGTRARLLYNVFGPRIAQVGSNGLPDVYERSRHLVDVTVAQRIGKRFDLKLAAENILNSPVRLTHGNDANGAKSVVNEYRTGATFTLSATFINE